MSIIADRKEKEEPEENLLACFPVRFELSSFQANCLHLSPWELPEYKITFGGFKILPVCSGMWISLHESRSWLATRSLFWNILSCVLTWYHIMVSQWNVLVNVRVSILSSVCASGCIISPSKTKIWRREPNFFLHVRLAIKLTCAKFFKIGWRLDPSPGP